MFSNTIKETNEIQKVGRRAPGKGWAFSPFFLRPYPISDQNTPMHLSLNHPISDLNSYSQETNDEKTKANPTLSDSTKPYLVSQKGKIYNQFLTFCLSKVGRIYSLYKLKSSPPPRPRPPLGPLRSMSPR